MSGRFGGRFVMGAQSMKSKWPQIAPRLAEIEIWLRDGLTEAQVCKNLGISVNTLNEYKKKYQELSESIKRGRQPIVTEIENALVKRALGYEYDEVKTYIKDEDGKTVKYTEKTRKHLPPDVGACAILLKNKAPEHYTNDRALLDFKRQELELKKMTEEARNW
jgi:transposase